MSIQDWEFVTDSGSWFVYRKGTTYKNINKHTGEIIVRRLTTNPN